MPRYIVGLGDRVVLVEANMPMHVQEVGAGIADADVAEYVARVNADPDDFARSEPYRFGPVVFEANN